ncbi:MAG TPA: hypothetical protein VE222_10105 [Nitrospiraceae bacterium]|nr:hypothetical protein [Nitrospiraceae bacterium]
MNKRSRKVERGAFLSEEVAVLSILNEWAPIGGAPQDEFECLGHQILSVLHQGATQAQVTHIIQAELSGHFGIQVESTDVERVAGQIAQWWLERQRS